MTSKKPPITEEEKITAKNKFAPYARKLIITHAIILLIF